MEYHAHTKRSNTRGEWNILSQMLAMEWYLSNRCLLLLSTFSLRSSGNIALKYLEKFITFIILLQLLKRDLSISFHSTDISASVHVAATEKHLGNDDM